MTERFAADEHAAQIVAAVVVDVGEGLRHPLPHQLRRQFQRRAIQPARAVDALEVAFVSEEDVEIGQSILAERHRFPFLSCPPRWRTPTSHGWPSGRQCLLKKSAPSWIKLSSALRREKKPSARGETASAAAETAGVKQPNAVAVQGQLTLP